jgi:hypothetical protein
VPARRAKPRHTVRFRGDADLRRRRVASRRRKAPLRGGPEGAEPSGRGPPVGAAITMDGTTPGVRKGRKEDEGR